MYVNHNLIYTPDLLMLICKQIHVNQDAYSKIYVMYWKSQCIEAIAKADIYKKNK